MWYVVVGATRPSVMAGGTWCCVHSTLAGGGAAAQGGIPTALSAVGDILAGSMGDGLSLAGVGRALGCCALRELERGAARGNKGVDPRVYATLAEWAATHAHVATQLRAAQSVKRQLGAPETVTELS